MATTVLGGALEFFNDLGVFEVLLPFLLVFTIVYAILEKTKIFGIEQGVVDGEKVKSTRKNLNSMTAFVIAFFVVASSRLVAIINEALANMVLLLLLGISFLILAGAFHKETEEGFFLTGPYKNIFMAVMLVGIFAIFLHAIGWLQATFEFLGKNWNNNAVTGLFLVLFTVLVIWFITRDKHNPSPSKKKSED